MKNDDIVFYLRKNNPKESNACLFQDFNKEKMILIETDYEFIEKVFHNKIKDISKWEYGFVDVRKINESQNKTYSVKWSNFDPRTMIIIENEERSQLLEFNLKTMLKEKKAPGLISSNNSKYKDMGSAFYNGKVDDGAIQDLADKALPDFENRIKERQKTMGHSYTKNDTNKVNLRRKK